ncbi:hypothetical protein [Streptococcus sp. AM43-2AT]|uniref:hypothetical protein n=1 Tax=Streptococcus sp. AM43-2AT TaxID=2293247 RepID=UPI001FB2526A|nr:hypothetical protein [Streptococcus sp. AM43-2AT]
MPYVDGNYVSFICNLQQSPRLLKLCGGGTTKSNSNELPISVPLSSFFSNEETIEIWDNKDKEKHQRVLE